MMVRSVLGVLFCTALASADITYFGPVATPGSATDLSGLTGTLAGGVPTAVLGSHGSGIAWTGKGREFLMVADRGPADGATAFRCRWQRVELGQYEDGAPSAAPKLLATVLLSDDKGRPFVGSAAAIDSGDDAKQVRLDPEAIRVGPDGTVYIAEEYGPSVLAFSPEGKLLKRFAVPEKFLCKHLAADAKDELPPKNTSGRQPNKGFEGLAISPAGDLLFALEQGPLLQDGALNDRGQPLGVNVRILQIPVAGGATKEFVVQMESPHLDLNELLAVNDHEFLMIERDEKAGEQAKIKRIVKIDIAGASDVSGVESLPATGLPGGVKPVARSTFLDMLLPKYGLNDERLPAKIEGLAFGPDLPDKTHTLFITSDNDAKPDESTWCWYFGIGAKDLPGFRPQQLGAK
jgi:hypothetical protein